MPYQQVFREDWLVTAVGGHWQPSSHPHGVRQEGISSLCLGHSGSNVVVCVCVYAYTCTNEHYCFLTTVEYSRKHVFEQSQKPAIDGKHFMARMIKQSLGFHFPLIASVFISVVRHANTY